MIHGGEAQGGEKEIQETHHDRKKEEEMTTRRAEMAGHMGKDRDVLIVQYPRGCSALVWLNPMTKQISTNHAGLRAMLQRGVKDWGGHLLFPRDGQAFLEALYDYLFLNGYRVHWTRVMSGDRTARHCN
jgi:hypothetical protein